MKAQRQKRCLCGQSLSRWLYDSSLYVVEIFMQNRKIDIIIALNFGQHSLVEIIYYRKKKDGLKICKIHKRRGCFFFNLSI